MSNYVRGGSTQIPLIRKLARGWRVSSGGRENSMGNGIGDDMIVYYPPD